jgi:1-hydroxycarotenoid 3,4-desaturase
MKVDLGARVHAATIGTASASTRSGRETRVVVIGAGIGGLVSALLLSAQGLDVTLVERAAAPGGKMRQVLPPPTAEAQAGAGLGMDRGIDAGPTVFTMRWVFDQILAQVGTSLAEQLRLQPLDVLARHAWQPAHAGAAPACLDLHADPARSTEAIGQFAGPAEARRFVAFCAEARRVYQTLEGPYIRSERPTLLRLARELGPSGLLTLNRLGPFASLWRTLARHFHDPRLQQLFGRYATYCGASPFAAPATLMLVAQVEMDGVWSVEGGMHALAQCFARLAQAQGARLRFGCGCEELLVEHGRIAGVRLADGSHLPADAVVFNGDAAALPAGLLGASVRQAVPAVPVQRRSLSALTWAMRAHTEGFALERHNVFFNRDYAGEFSDIFGQGRLPREGTVYVCAQDRGAGPDLPHGADERLLCLVNAPAGADLRPLDPTEIRTCEQTSLAMLRRCGLQVEPRSVEITGPAEFHRLFPATGGALYGQASHGWMASFRRPGACSAVPGLYLAGGSVHPGPGVPMAALSGRLAAETLLAHLASTSRSAPVRISGGMSTP